MPIRVIIVTWENGITWLEERLGWLNFLLSAGTRIRYDRDVLLNIRWLNTCSVNEVDNDAIFLSLFGGLFFFYKDLGGISIMCFQWVEWVNSFFKIFCLCVLMRYSRL